MAGEEARAFLHSLLQDYDSAKHAKILFDYCLKNYEKKDEIMDMLLAEISLISAGGKKGVFHLLNSLLKDKEWQCLIKSVIRNNVKILAEESILMASATTCEMILGWSKDLEIEIDPPLKDRLKRICVENDAEQKRKKKVLEVMEKGREEHKIKREECWSRPAGETVSDEFLLYYRQSKNLTSQDLKLMSKNQTKFLELNQRKRSVSTTLTNDTKRSKLKEPVKRKEPVNVFVLDIEESFVFLESFLKEGVSNSLKAVAREVDDMIVEIATRLFFYQDLKRFKQPNIQYFARYEQPLDGYRVEKDRLAVKNPHPDDPDYFLERAYRSKIIRATFTDQNHLKLMGKPFAEKLKRCMEGLDHGCSTLNSLARSILALLATDPSIEIFAMAPRSLPRLFATISAFGLDRLIPAERIYSTTAYGHRWCLEDIKARYEGQPAKFYLCSAYTDCEADARSLGYELIRVRGRSDMMSFAEKFKLG